MAKSLLIVESPAKVKTIGKCLGPDFEVKASVGHIIDLPKKKLGVDVAQGFRPQYEIIDGKQKVISELKKAAKGKEAVYLGTDPDREGEAIAWHLAQALGDGYDYRRISLTELTPQGIRRAVDHPGPISRTRFESQQTRRILDRLMGYLISPLLWDKLKRGLSAGRVQSVALRLIVERERAIFAFTAEEYWTLTAEFKVGGEYLAAQLHKIGGRKAALSNEAETLDVMEKLAGAVFAVSALEKKERRRHPLPPFTTSTLQQAAFNRLKMPSKRTMRLAQELYEGLALPGEEQVGLITYMRTDSVRISEQAAGEAREYIRRALGPDFVPASPNRYKNKKGAQDAHEAIRPTDIGRTPAQLKGKLESGLWQIYDLIWRRFMASQAAPAILDQTAVELSAGPYVFRASGSTVRFPGFLTLYDPGAEEDKGVIPPGLAQGETLSAGALKPKQHFTQPPPRFTEATLVKELEIKGIGRPSTYTAIISTLRDKEYVEAAKGSLAPTEMGLAVTDLLVKSFPELMEVDFTAGLEENLDEIEEGRAEQQAVLARFYEPLARDLKAAETAMINLRREGRPVGLACPACGGLAGLTLRYGRNGFYLACPDCAATCDFERDERGEPRPTAPPPAEPVAVCEKCGRPMVIKKSRYGPFVACTGYPECKNAKPLAPASGDGGQAAGAEEPPPLPEGAVCEKCGRPLAPKKNRQGSWFISCTGYPKCKNAKPFPSGVKCPKEGCDGEIVEKSSKRGVFYGCSRYPKCRVILKGRPVKEACPVCGRSFLLENPASKKDASAPPLICSLKDCPGPGGA